MFAYLLIIFNITIMKKIILSALVATTLFACKETATPKPEFDLANAKKEIEAANNDLSNAIAKGDTVAVGNTYTIDAKVLYPERLQL